MIHGHGLSDTHLFQREVDLPVVAPRARRDEIVEGRVSTKGPGENVVRCRHAPQDLLVIDVANTAVLAGAYEGVADHAHAGGEVRESGNEIPDSTALPSGEDGHAAVAAPVAVTRTDAPGQRGVDESTGRADGIRPLGRPPRSLDSDLFVPRIPGFEKCRAVHRFSEFVSFVETV